MEHIIGYVIIGLSVLLTTPILIYSKVRWDRRWDVNRFGGILVRFDRSAVHTPELGRELEAGLTHIAHTLRERFPDEPKLTDFRVEIVTPGGVSTPTVPAGKLRDGTPVGGSIRTERWLPITKKHHVAVVVNERTVAFIAHEVCTHITPFRRGHGLNAKHTNAIYADLEKAAKANIAKN